HDGVGGGVDRVRDAGIANVTAVRRVADVATGDVVGGVGRGFIARITSVWQLVGVIGYRAVLPVRAGRIADAPVSDNGVRAAAVGRFAISFARIRVADACGKGKQHCGEAEPKGTAGHVVPGPGGRASLDHRNSIIEDSCDDVGDCVQAWRAPNRVTPSTVPIGCRWATAAISCRTKRRLSSPPKGTPIQGYVVVAKIGHGGMSVR